MVRRTVLIAIVLGTASAAGALAAASELVPMKWGFLRGFTPAPTSLDSVLGSEVAFPVLESDSGTGEFCPLPTNHDSPGVLAAGPTTSELFLEGMSTAPGAVSDSVCTGDTLSARRFIIRK